MKGIYVFDLDGTLVDSMARFESGTLRVLDEEGIAYDSELIKILTPLGYTKTAEYYIEHFGVQGSVESIVQRIEKNLVHEYTYNIGLKPGVREYLQKLKAEGARTYVLTASPHIVTDVCLRRNGVYDLFDCVWSVEDFGMSKAETRLFDAVAAKIGCRNADVHFFDDNLIAVTTAAKAGWRTYGVQDRHTTAEIEALKAAADVFVPSFEVLI